MGYNGQTEVITDLSSISPNSPTFGNTSSETSSSDETKGAGDLLYERDINLVENVYGELRAPIAGAIGSYSTDYWIASREFDTSGGFYYRIRYINSNYSSTLSSYWVYGYYGNLTHDSSVAARIRPIVVLKSGLVPTGTGTSDDPYVLE